MICSIETARARLGFGPEKTEEIQARLRGIEDFIRAYTNNKFQDRKRRERVRIKGQQALGSLSYFRTGDLVEISESGLNAGVYRIERIDAKGCELSGGPLTDEGPVLMTRVSYPWGVQEVALRMLDWDLTNRSKLGIASETLSRHSISYADQNQGQHAGYPLAIISGLAPWVKARL